MRIHSSTEKPAHLPRRTAAGRLIGTIIAMGFVAACTLPRLAESQDGFPSRPITIVVPSAPGGSLDPLARALAPGMTRRLGQPVVVDNKPGAAGLLATQHVARSAPDGHTILLSFDSHVMNSVVARQRRPLPYDIFKDFASVSLVARIPFVMATSGAVPGKTAQEFISYAKDNKGRLSYGSSGVGGMSHFAGERFKQVTGTDIVHIPYQGAAGIPRLMANDVQLYFSSYLLMRPGVQNGTIKVLAIADSKRSSEIPDVPTMAEAGFPGFEAYTWYGAFAPANTPASVVQRLHAVIAETLNDPEVRSNLTGSGFTLIGSTPAELTRFVRSEFDRWDKFVTETNLKLAE